jgi:hypothetical protein
MTGYSVEIIESSKELTAREKISAKDFSNATALDTELMDANANIVITPSAYLILNVHNEHSKNDKDYKKYLIIDTAGNKFVTGSESFFTAFKDIFDAMSKDAPGEEYSIEVYKKPSKNYQGKHFLTCSILP